MLSTTPIIPDHAATHYYSKNVAFNIFSLVGLVYTTISNLSIACIRPIPILNRGLPQIQSLPSPSTIDDDTTNNNKEKKTKKIAIVTGSNTGIGFETSLALVERGYEVVLACRSKTKAQQAIEKIQQEIQQQQQSTSSVSGSGKAVFHTSLDLSNFQSVRDFSTAIQKKYDHIDILVNNAGMNTSGPSGKLDLGFKVNFLGHFLLTNLLINKLLEAHQPRIINLSSVMHHYCLANKHDETYWKQNAIYDENSQNSSYSASKLAALLFSIQLNQRYKSQGLQAITVNPGAV